MNHHVVHMAAMGLLVSVVAPVLTLGLARWAPALTRYPVPAAVALPGFVALHATVTVAVHGSMAPSLSGGATHLLLLLGAVLFWAPVLGGRRLADGVRVMYLFVAMPLLDLAGVWMVAVGDSAGGLAMITGMLPMGLIAVGLVWSWVAREERRAQLEERAAAAVAEGGERR